MLRIPSILVLLGLAGCGIEYFDDGPEADWVHQRVRILHGQNPLSAQLVDALVEISLSAPDDDDQDGFPDGREDVVEILLNDPAFTTYWSVAMAEILLPDRAGAMGQSEACWDQPHLDPVWYADLVQHLTWADPDEAFCVQRTPGEDVWLPTGPSRDPVPPGQLQRRSTPAMDGGFTLFGAGGAVPEEDERASEPGGQGDLHGNGPPTSPGHGREDTPILDAPADEDPVRGDPTVLVRPEGLSSQKAAGADVLFYQGQPEVSEPESVRLDFTALEGTAPRSEEPAGTECYPYSMRDALLAAVSEDDLFGFIRVSVMPLHATYVSTLGEPNKRNDLANRFLAAYVERDESCLGCHNATYSTTDARPRNKHWDRFVPLPWDLEGAAFAREDEEGWHYGGNGEGLVASVAPYFRTDQFKEPDPQQLGPSGDTYQPFGLSETCTPALGALAPDTSAFSRGGIAGEPVSAVVGLEDLTRILREGATHLFSAGLTTPPALPSEFNGEPYDCLTATEDEEEEPGYDPVEFTLNKYSCWGCHNQNHNCDPSNPNEYACAPTVSELEDIVWDMNSDLFYKTIVEGSRTGLMPPVEVGAGAPSDAYCIQQVLGYDPPKMPSRGDAALVTLVASRVVSGVLEEVSGRKMVLAHAYSRNDDQRDIQYHMVHSLVGSGWSLRALLRDVVLSPAVGRAAPEASTQRYPLALVFNPFADPGPATDKTEEQLGNGTGDLIQRRSPNHLVNALHQALWWPAPRVHGGRDAYPTATQMSDIGRQMTLRAGSQRGSDLTVATGWQAVVGACEKPETVYAAHVRKPYWDVPPSPSDLLGPDQWFDWIDAMLDAGIDDGATAFDAFATVKERLVAESGIDLEEQQILVSLLDGAPLDTPLDLGHESALRDYCGALTMTPQFTLSGLAPPNPGDAPSPTDFGNDDKPTLICVDPMCDTDAYLDTYLERLDSL